MEKKYPFLKLHHFVFFLSAVVLVTNLIPFLTPSAQALVGRLYKGDRVEVVLGCQINTDTITAGTQFTAKVKTAFR